MANDLMNLVLYPFVIPLAFIVVCFVLLLINPGGGNAGDGK